MAQSHPSRFTSSELNIALMHLYTSPLSVLMMAVLENPHTIKLNSLKLTFPENLMHFYVFKTFLDIFIKPFKLNKKNVIKLN